MIIMKQTKCAEFTIGRIQPAQSTVGFTLTVESRLYIFSFFVFLFFTRRKQQAGDFSSRPTVKFKHIQMSFRRWHLSNATKKKIIIIKYEKQRKHLNQTKRIK